MRSLAFGPRQSGRTTQLVNEMIRDMSYHTRRVYVVAGTFHIANEVKRIIQCMNGDKSRVTPVSIDAIYTLKGADVLDVYFEHTAYEQANSHQLREIYQIEDRQVALIWGAP